MSFDPYAFGDPTRYREVILKIYQEDGLAVGALFADGLPYLATHASTLSQNNRAVVLIAQLDEAIAFLLLVSLKLQAYLVSDPSSQRTAMCGLLSQATSVATGVRQLVCSGLVLPAIQLCRPLRDLVNVALLCVIKPEVTSRYLETVEPKAANKFWHEFLAREKDLKAIDAALVEHAGSAAGLFPHLETDLDEMLGMMVHPSFGGGAIAMGADLLQMFGDKTDPVLAAHRPLSFANHQIFRLLLGAFRPGVLPGSHVDDLIPADDVEFVAKWRKSLVVLHLVTIIRLSSPHWASSSPSG